MQQNTKESILKRIEDLRLEYVGRSRFVGYGQHSMPYPDAPIVHWQNVAFDIEHNDSININRLCLTIASKDSCNELLEVLLDAGADPNYQETRKGWKRSILGQACLARAYDDKPKPEFKNAKLLLQKGVQLKLPYKFNSKNLANSPAIQLLLEKGAKLEDICVEPLSTDDEG